MLYILLRNDRSSAGEIMVILSLLVSSPGFLARIIVGAPLHPLGMSRQILNLLHAEMHKERVRATKNDFFFRLMLEMENSNIHYQFPKCLGVIKLSIHCTVLACFRSF